MYHHHKILHNSSPTLINTQYNSLIDKYKNDITISLHIFRKVMFKKLEHNKIIHLISFNIHKNPKDRYKELLLLFHYFHKSKTDLKTFVHYNKMFT